MMAKTIQGPFLAVIYPHEGSIRDAERINEETRPKALKRVEASLKAQKGQWGEVFDYRAQHGVFTDRVFLQSGLVHHIDFLTKRSRLQGKISLEGTPLEIRRQLRELGRALD